MKDSTLDRSQIVRKSEGRNGEILLISGTGKGRRRKVGERGISGRRGKGTIRNDVDST